MRCMKAIELLECHFSTLALAPLAGAAGLWLVAAAEAGERAVATIRDTNLRRAPGIESEVQTLIPKGTRVEVGDCFPLGARRGQAAPRKKASCRAPERVDFLMRSRLVFVPLAAWMLARCAVR
jgi:hypothetical protein